MAKTHLLESDVFDPPHVDADDAKVRRLEAELRTARLDTEKAMAQLATARASIAALRTQLLPLHRALKAVFGEIEMVVGEDEATPAAGGAPTVPQASNPVWTEWKQRLGGACAKIIDALLKHKDADTSQLCILIGTGRRQTVADAICKMNRAGLINKNGGRFSLKEL